MAPIAMKRKAASANAATHAAKRNRVVNALAGAEAVPESLRSLLKQTLPIVLNANKADRHSYESEVVEQAQQAFVVAQAALEQAQVAALATQNAMISPAERAKRVSAKKDAAAHLEAVKATLEANKATKKGCEKTLQDAEDVLNAALKDARVGEKQTQKIENKKATLSNALANELVMVREGTSASAEGKKAVKTLVALGKEYSLGSTLLGALPLACKKDVASRTEFENMMFGKLQDLLNQKIDGLSQEIAAAQPVQAAKVAAETSANEAHLSAVAAFNAAKEELAATHAAHSAAVKDVARTDSHLRKIWEDMRQVCEAHDRSSNDVKDFKENVWTAFMELKEKVPEPEPVEEPEAVEAAPDAEPAEEAVGVSQSP